MRRVYGVLLVGLLMFIPTSGWADEEMKNPFAGDEAAIAEGDLLFQAVCAGYCHVKAGADRDGKCPNLFDCEWVNGSGTDEEMFKVVSDGVPKTEMVGFAGQLPDDMLWQILAYVRAASKCESSASPAANGTSQDAASSDTAAVPAHQ